MDAASAPVRLAPAEAARLAIRTSTLSVAAAGLLIVMKGGAWLASGSVALLSSLADSGLDLAASLFTLFAIRYAATPPDREHRFGHGKAEAFAGLAQAGLVLGSAALVGLEAARRLVDPEPIAASGAAIGVMLASLGVTGLLIWAQTRTVRATGSLAVAGDRAHYLADFASNIAVLIGVAFAGAFPIADPLAGVFVAGYLLYGGIGVLRGAADHLMDRELPDEERARIEALALAEPGVLGVHELRTRASGLETHIQLHVDVDGELTVREAHRILLGAEARIRAVYPGADVIIHANPKDSAEPHGREAGGW